ncbi:MAG: hypothetical protein AB1405_03385, partial [Bdellovibrionota bacterium]
MPCPKHTPRSLGGENPEGEAYSPSPGAEALVRSPEFLTTICAHVLKGGSPHIAAQAEGMEEEDDYWYFWYEGKKAKKKLEQERTDLEKILIKFVKEINKALAKARLTAEQTVFQKLPQLYLTGGPGRPGGGEKRGWSKGPKEELELEQKRFKRFPSWSLRFGHLNPDSEYARRAALEQMPAPPPVFCAECNRLEEEKIFALVESWEKEDKEKLASENEPHPQPLEANTEI